MKFIKSFPLIILLALLFHNHAQASHIVGGEISYKCLGNDQYEVTILVYRDSVNGSPGAFFDDPLFLGIFDPVTGAFLNTESFSLRAYSTIYIPNYLGNVSLLSSIGFQKGIYRDTINLPFRTNGYQLAYQRCCRNNIIQNIINPNSTGFTMTIELTEAALLSCNSSPTPVEDVPLFLCVADSFEVDMSATDAQGDSLVYEFYTPFDGANQGNPAPNPPAGPPYLPFTWQSPASQNNQVPGVQLHAQTGRFTGYSNSTGYYAMGIAIKEYRNGVLMSTTYRDFSLTLVPCMEMVTVNKIEAMIGLKLAPNPVARELNITLESDQEVQLVLYSALGQQLLSKSFYSNTVIDMNQLPKGIYMLAFTIGTQQVVRKIIKD